jgi:hypothetical protein
MINHPHRSKKTHSEITKEQVVKILSLFDMGLRSGLGTGKPGDMCVEAVICNVLEDRNADDPKCVSRVLRALKIRLNDSSWSSNDSRAQGMRRLGIAQLGSAGFLDENEFIQRVLGVVIRKAFPGAFRAVAAVMKNDADRSKWSDLAARCEAAPEQIKPREARQFFVEFKQNAAADDAAAYAADDAAAYAAAAADDAAYAAAYAAAADDAAYAAAADDAAAYADAYAADAAYAAAAYAAAAYAAAAYAPKKRAEARDKSLATFCEWIVEILIDMKVPGCQWLDLAPAASAVS